MFNLLYTNCITIHFLIKKLNVAVRSDVHIGSIDAILSKSERISASFDKTKML